MVSGAKSVVPGNDSALSPGFFGRPRSCRRHDRGQDFHIKVVAPYSGQER